MSVKSKPYSDEARWNVIYPAYMNSKRTKFEGRRIPLAKAVINPTCQEIQDILQHEGFNSKIEKNKMYPREKDREEDFLGRIRIQLKNDDGAFVNEKYKSTEAVMIRVAELIPQLKTRTASGAPVPPTAPQTQQTGKKKKR
uniref:Signal recognition particle 19 kDa protein n=1 Tax=Panagrolaimus sp. JU765 TaxID=591449 RepID=A0AC34QA77_9BILA